VTKITLNVSESPSI